LFFPQNEEYVKTSEMVKLIADTHGKNIKLTKILNPLIVLLMKFNVRLLNKIFGDLVYDKSISKYKVNYNLYNLKDSILATERV